MSDAKTTTNHHEIRKWAESRGAVPASVAGTERAKEAAGILRLDFDPKDKDLDKVDWDDFFAKFDKEKLAFLYQDKTADGQTSRFHKFVSRS